MPLYEIVIESRATHHIEAENEVIAAELAIDNEGVVDFLVTSVSIHELEEEE